MALPCNSGVSSHTVTPFSERTEKGKEKTT